MTTAIRASPKRRRRKGTLAPSLGPWVCAWIERCLVHGEGDYYGRPFRLRAWQKALLYRAYELRPDGTRRYSRVLWGLPKGQGKTELAAAVACAEFAGPVVCVGFEADGRARAAARVSPDIPVAAASFEQADLLFGAARTMIRGGALAPLCEVYDTEILLKNRPGRLYRVAAVAGTNDGRRPTFFVADELHEWTGTKERVHLVLSNGRAKRRDAWELAISTAGCDSTSLLGRLYQHGKRVLAGDVTDPTFLFEWHEAPPDFDLGDPAQWETAVRLANPAAGDFLPLENLRERYRTMPEHEFRRYHLNQWVGAPERWFGPGVWEGCAVKGRVVPEGAPIVIGFDGSYTNDSTAIIGCTLEEMPHLWVIGAWEKPAADDPTWRVAIMDVEQAIREACGRWKVRAVACDPHRWQRSIELLGDEGLPMITWPSHSATRMVPACAQVYDAVQGRQLTQDGDERLARHVANATIRIDSRGPRISKDHKDSARKIDLAVAAVIAFDMAVRLRAAPQTQWRLL